MSEYSHPNLITILPECINISHFIPGKIYKPSFIIYNTCNIPIILNLRSSDRNKLILSDNLIRLEVNQSKKINLVIQDQINYSTGKIPIKKKLFINLNGEFVEEKYEINLIYFTQETEANLETESNIEGISNLAAEYLKYGQADSNENSNQNVKNTNKGSFITNKEIPLSPNPQNNSINNVISIGNSQIENLDVNDKNINPISKLNNNQNENIGYKNKNEEENINKRNNIIQKNCDFGIICNKSNLEKLNDKAKILLDKMQEMSNILQEFEKNIHINKERYDSRFLLRSSMSVYSFGKNIFLNKFKDKKKEINKNYNNLEKICVLTENKLLLIEKEELIERYKLLENKLNKYKHENMKKKNCENDGINDLVSEQNLFLNKISSNLTPLKSRETSQFIEQTPII
jgi:hypothetical protein